MLFGGDVIKPSKKRGPKPEYRERRITTTFSQTTPESAEQGDYSDTGWIDEEGVDMNLDEYDREEGLTVAEKTAKWLFNEGASEGSSSHYHHGMWYSTEWSVNDYSTGEEEQRSFHLDGFTADEEEEIFRIMQKKWRRR